VNARPSILLDGRQTEEIVRDLLSRRLGFVPEWQVVDGSPDSALARILARYLYAIIKRLNQAPEKNKLAFLDLLGLALVPAQAARVPIVFEMSADAGDGRAPAGTQLAAPPPPESSEQIVFETERATGLGAAKLSQVVSLWPGRDQYLDHTAPLLAGESVQLFRKPALIDTPHELYLAHEKLLALAGSVTVEVEFELTQPSSEHLSLLWQYWDGKLWRSFKYVKPACSEKEAANADSTNGFTSSGRFKLEADCAESKKTVVNGVESFWIRARLTEPLVPDPSKALPRVETIRLSSIISNPLKATLGIVAEDLGQGAATGISIRGAVANEAGYRLPAVGVKITCPEDPGFDQQSDSTSAIGEYSVTLDDPVLPGNALEFQVSFLKLEATGVLRDFAEDHNQKVDLTFNVDGLDPEKAFSDASKVDVTKPFFPFGQQPQPGSVFYFSQPEVFGKPGAKVQLYVARTESPLDKIDVISTNTAVLAAGAQPSDERLQHLISWEYWNGRKWITLFQSTEPSSSLSTSSSQPTRPVADFETTEIIEFTVPSDIEPTKVNDEENLWMRARLVRGGFGFARTIVWHDQQNTENQFTYVISQPPSIAAFRLGYSWRYGPFHAEHVRTHNDFQFEDRTYEAKWPGETFLPFRRVEDVTPALYLGFDKKLPVDRLGLYFDIDELKGDTRGPALAWEYFDGAEWRGFSVEDETSYLRVPGILSFIAAEDSQPMPRFGTERHWIRGRLKEDGPPGEPTVNGIFTNAVWASQQRTINDTPLGASSGLPDQIFVFTQIPVLDGERIEVREIAGARANVEWRILALEVSGGDPNIIRELEDALGRENPQIDLVYGDIRLRRDRNKKVAEVWVHWKGRPHLFFSGPEDRVYVVDRARGLLFFGNGENGKIPPPGSQILARKHRAGGGQTGNVPKGAIKQMLGAISGVQAVSNARAAEGGADAETIERFSERGPRSIRHRGRAILPSDYETLAREASASVAFARAIPTRSDSGRPLAGWVTLIVIPHNKDPRPYPSFGLRQQVRRFLEERAPACVAGAQQIYVTGPEYLAIDVKATIAPRDPAEAGAVEGRARLALEDFLHPLGGGPARRGWELGRDVYMSDIAAVLERVEGVDYVKELELLVDGQLQGERIAVADSRIVSAGEIRLKMESSEL